MQPCILIGLGSAIGGVVRYCCSELVAQYWIGSFPLGTLLVNLLGSFLIGILAALTAPGAIFDGSVIMRQLLMLGFCGGYTTFSAFSLQTLDLIREGSLILAGLNIGLSLLLCLVAVWIGAVLTEYFML